MLFITVFDFDKLKSNKIILFTKFVQGIQIPIHILPKNFTQLRQLYEKWKNIETTDSFIIPTRGLPSRDSLEGSSEFVN